MKNLVFIFSCVCIMSCNSSTTNANAVVNSVDTNHYVADTKLPAAKIDSMDFTDSTTKDFGKIGEELLKNENVGGLKLGLSAENTLALIGKPDSKSAATEWGADGLFHQDWDYESQSIELNMSGEDSLNMEIFAMTIANPRFQTTRGIGAGSTYSQVRNAYKDAIDPSFSNGSKLVAGSIYGGEIFFFQQNQVKSIFFGAAAE